MKFRGIVLVSLSGLVLALAACSSTQSPTATTITATLTEYKIELSATSAPAGQVTFNVTNGGAMVHEFVVLKTDTLAADLPIVDGVVAEEDFGALGEVPETNPGVSGTVTLDLTAGHYAIICNITGHVGLGMVIDFTVN